MSDPAPQPEPAEYPRMTDAMQRSAEWARAMLVPVPEVPDDEFEDPDYGL